MTNPIQPTTGGLPSNIGISQGVSIKRAAIPPAVTSVPLTPDPQKAILATKRPDLVALLAMPSQIRGAILTALSDRELTALDIALNKQAFPELHKEITKIQQNRLLQEILADHPAWKSAVDAWQVSREDKIWLCQVYELCEPKLDIEAIHPIVKKASSVCKPSALSLNLLKPDTKKKITTALNSITFIAWAGKKLKKCPKAICLLSSADMVHLDCNQLTSPPDVSKLIKLKKLKLDHNSLTTPPDVRENINLETLWLHENKLTVPPDVRKNVKLKYFSLENNQLTTSPDLSKNVDLREIDLGNNPLIAPPDTSKNVELGKILIRNTPLKTPPDTSKNVKLMALYLQNNKLTTSPDVSKNGNLIYLDLSNNPLTVMTKKALVKLKSERKEIEIHH